MKIRKRIEKFDAFLKGMIGIDLLDFVFCSLMFMCMFAFIFSEFFSASCESEESIKNDKFRQNIEKTVKDFTNFISEKLYPTNLFPQANYRMFNVDEYIEKNTYYPNVHTNIHMCGHPITIIPRVADENAMKPETKKNNVPKADVTDELESVTIKFTLSGARATFKFKDVDKGEKE